MYKNFNKVDDNKKAEIINVSLKEFSENGYESASTNVITKTANISKGSLFNYFGSKKGLYIFLLDYSIEVVEQFYNQIDKSEPDLFKRLENIGVEKLKTQKQFPYSFDFLTNSITEESAEVKNIINEKINDTYIRGLNSLYDDIDYSLFKKEIDVQKAIEILTWTMFGFADKYMPQIESFESVTDFGGALLNDWQEYAEILKRSFYK